SAQLQAPTRRARVLQVQLVPYLADKWRPGERTAERSEAEAGARRDPRRTREDIRPRKPKARNRAGGDIRSVNRPEQGTCARFGGTTARWTIWVHCLLPPVAAAAARIRPLDPGLARRRAPAVRDRPRFEVPIAADRR